MIQEKQKLSGILNSKQSLNGSLSNSVIYVDPITQEKIVIPTTDQQIVTPDENYTGLSKVTVEAIQDENLISENIKNGVDILGVTGNLKDKILGTKNITENGVYKASDDNLDGYSEVTVGIKSLFTGHYDAEGLRQIGWTDEEIEYYQNNGVQWNESEDEYFKLNETELAGDDSGNTRFLPKNSTKNKFNGYYRLLAIPLLNTTSLTNMGSMFYYCYSLTTIPLLDTSNVTNMSNMFESCYSLKTIPQLVTSSVTNMGYMFSNCKKITEVPQLDTSSVTSINNAFGGCISLTTLPELNLIKAINISNMFQNCPVLENLDGFANLGQEYSTKQSANYSSYKLDLSKSTKLTEQSLINVLTNLYDIKTKGCKAQQVVLGSNNLAKLVSEEGQQALSNSQAKGWSIS